MDGSAEFKEHLRRTSDRIMQALDAPNDPSRRNNELQPPAGSAAPRPQVPASQAPAGSAAPRPQVRGSLAPAQVPMPGRVSEASPRTLSRASGAASPAPAGSAAPRPQVPASPAPAGSKIGGRTTWDLKLELKIPQSLLFLALGALLREHRVELEPRELTYIVRKNVSTTRPSQV